MSDLSNLSRRAARIKILRDSKKWWKWILAAILGIGVAFAVAAILRKLNARSAELARLRTELEQRKVEAEQKEHEAKVETHRQRAAELERQATALRDEVALIERQYISEEAMHKQAMSEIDQIKDWAGLDRYNAEGR